MSSYMEEVQHKTGLPNPEPSPYARPCRWDAMQVPAPHFELGRQMRAGKGPLDGTHPEAATESAVFEVEPEEDCLGAALVRLHALVLPASPPSSAAPLLFWSVQEVTSAALA